MFACAMYPIHPASLLLDITEEARQQFLRLNSHPSIALWGGNNENEAALSWFEETRRSPDLYKRDYEVLFVKLLLKLVRSLDPDVIYVDSSPSNGIYHSVDTHRSKINKSTSTSGGGGVMNNNNNNNSSNFTYEKRWGDVGDPNYGDVHFYDYSSNLLDARSFPNAKFVSEFGFQSLPSFDAFKAQSAPEDWDVNAELMRYRMRHAGGFEEMEKQLEMHFLRCPLRRRRSSSSGGGEKVRRNCQEAFNVAFLQKNTTISNKDAAAVVTDAFRGFIYFTQLQQALIYEVGALKWRRNKIDQKSTTAGLLYWQLNDVWAGPSWSGINWDGQWKALHYQARKFFNPAIVFGALVDDDDDNDDDDDDNNDNNNDVSVAKERRRREIQIWMVNDYGSHAVVFQVWVEAVPFNATSADDDDDVLLLYFNESASVPPSVAEVVWQSTLNDSAWGSIEAAAPHIFIRIRFCAVAVAVAVTKKKNGKIVQENEQDVCFENYLLLGEVKAAAIVDSVNLIVERVPMEKDSLVGASVNLTAVEPVPMESSLRMGLRTVTPSLKQIEREGNEEEKTALRLSTSTFFHGRSLLDHHHHESKRIKLRLTAHGGVALFVYLESAQLGQFSDNLFMVVPGQPKVVEFKVSSSSSVIDIELFEESLRVTWLQGAQKSGGSERLCGEKTFLIVYFIIGITAVLIKLSF